MRYLGGKSRIAKQLAAVINARREPGQQVWDAFCGGLAMTWALREKGPVVCSDGNARLIGLYHAVRAGWVPPEQITGPSEDPVLSAYIHFCLGFGGIPGAGIQAPYRRAIVKTGPETGRVKEMWPHRATAERIVREVRAAAAIYHADFLRLIPRQTGAVLYLDPPYQGTQGYDGGTFDSVTFFLRAVEWSAFGPVFISEYSCPVGHEVWARPMKTGQFARGNRTEKLFYLGPE